MRKPKNIPIMLGILFLTFLLYGSYRRSIYKISENGGNTQKENTVEKKKEKFSTVQNIQNHKIEKTKLMNSFSPQSQYISSKNLPQLSASTGKENYKQEFVDSQKNPDQLNHFILEKKIQNNTKFRTDKKVMSSENIKLSNNKNDMNFDDFKIRPKYTDKNIVSKSWFWEADKSDRKKIVQERDKAFLRFIKDTEKIENIKYPRLPGLIGLGVEKCGTGALQCMLETHPMLLPAAKNGREIHYFDRKEEYSEGIGHYLRQFPQLTNYQIAMEKSPSYFTDAENIPRQVKEDVPNAKLYAMVCDPVNRTYSDFRQEIWKTKLPRTSNYDKLINSKLLNLLGIKSSRLQRDDDAMSNFIFDSMDKDINNHIITHGLYYYHLKRWMKLYTKNDLLVIDGEEIMKEPWNVVEKVQEFLQIPKFITKENFIENRDTGFYFSRPLLVNQTKNGQQFVTYGEPNCYVMKNKGRTRSKSLSEKINSRVVNLLTKFYKPYNEFFFNLIGEKYDWQ
ncbi:heparan sulfate glucosamine 3-O-sulfotransferase 1-like isoform X1 [Styela clava]